MPDQAAASPHTAAQPQKAATLCIVLPVLNEAATLPQCLQALQVFRQRGARVVVVDGGSEDNTLAIAKAHPQADQVLQAPRGRAAQMNTGAASCVAAVYWFVHADTQLPPDADRLVRLAARGPLAWGRFDVHIDSPRPLLRLVSTLMNLRSRCTGIATGDQAIFVRRAVFENIGGFPNLPLMEDIAMSRALKLHGPPLCLKARVTTSARRWHQHGVWRTIFLMWRLRAAYFLGADPRNLALRYGYRPQP